MAQVNLRLRKWGNSIGVVVPQEVLIGEKAKEGDEVKVIIKKKKSDLRKLWGKYKFKQPTEEIMKEIDKELYNDN